jgi:hypothetical protein
MERIAPSARLEEQIAELLSSGLGGDGEHLADWGGWALGWCCSGPSKKK